MPAPDATAASLTQIFAGQSTYFGTGISSTDLLNLQNGNAGSPPNVSTIAYRFIAKRTSTVSAASVSFQLGSGLSLGTGGCYEARILPDNGLASHVPVDSERTSVSANPAGSYTENTTLAPVTVYQYKGTINHIGAVSTIVSGNAGGIRNFVWTSGKPQLTAGVVYHLEVRNIDRLPNGNYQSLRTLFSSPGNSPDPQPIYDYASLGVTTRGSNGVWIPSTQTTPVFAIQYSDNRNQGQAYTTPTDTLAAITGPLSKVRQTFTPNVNFGIGQIATRAGLWNSNKPLLLRVKDPSNTVMASAAINADVFTTVQNQVASRPEHAWQVSVLTSGVLVSADKTYSLEFECSSPGEYRQYALDPATSNMPASARFDFGEAQFTTDGSTWQIWPGTVSTDTNDLQFYFVKGSAAPSGPVTPPTGGPTPFYGTGRMGGLQNYQVGRGRVFNYRFRATHSGTAASYRFYKIMSGSTTNPTGYYAGDLDLFDSTGNSYSSTAGDYGVLDISIHTDDGTSAHKPTSTVLGTKISQALNTNGSLGRGGGAGVQYTFPAPRPVLVSGQIYHIYHKNSHSNEDRHWFGVDTQHTFHNYPDALRDSSGNDTDNWDSSPYQPWMDPTGILRCMTASTSSLSTSTSWTLNNRSDPQFEIGFENGAFQGYAYGMEIMYSNPAKPGQLLGGSNRLRQTMTISGGDKKVNIVKFRLMGSSGTGGSGTITIQLKNSSGNVIASAVTPNVSGMNLTTGNTAQRAVTLPLSSTVTLVNGQSYTLEFSGGSSVVCRIEGVKSGSAYGYATTSYFSDGLMQYSTNGGSSWNTTLNDNSGNADTGIDMQFVLCFQ